MKRWPCVSTLIKAYGVFGFIVCGLVNAADDMALRAPLMSASGRADRIRNVTRVIDLATAQKSVTCCCFPIWCCRRPGPIQLSHDVQNIFYTSLVDQLTTVFDIPTTWKSSPKKNQNEILMHYFIHFSHVKEFYLQNLTHEDLFGIECIRSTLSIHHRTLVTEK
jgi:hypothetical protein